MDQFESIALLFDECTRLADDEQPSAYLTMRQGSVVLLGEDGEASEEIGRFEAILIDVDGVSIDGESLFDVCDTTQSTLDYYNALFDGLGVLKPTVQDVAFGFDLPWCANVLILDRLALLPAYRGHGRGLIVLRGLIRYLRAGAGLIAMKPFPLQGEQRASGGDEEANGRLQLDQYTRNMRKATAALVRHYKLLGFKRLPGTPYMVRDAMRPLPSVHDLMASLARRRSRSR